MSTRGKLQGRVMHVPLDHIVLDTSYQPRGVGDGTEGEESLDTEHLERLLASDPGEWPPLLVTPSEGDPRSFILLDGWHRYKVASLFKLVALPCQIVEHGGLEEAFEANLRHGLPLKRVDRKAYAHVLHDVYPDLPYREIGRRVGLDPKTVKTALTDTEEIPQQASGGDGVSSTGNHVGAEEYAKRLSRALHAFFESITGQRGDERRTRLLVEVGKGKDREATHARALEYRALARSLDRAATELERSG